MALVVGSTESWLPLISFRRVAGAIGSLRPPRKVTVGDGDGKGNV